MASIKKVTGGYRARWRTPAGESRSKTFQRKVDAERHLTTMEHSKLAGSYIDPSAGKVTLREYALEWQASRIHRDSTANGVDIHLRVHILPQLGHRPIAQVRHSEVQAWVRGRSDVLSPGTVLNVFRTLSGIMRSAVRDRLIASNPCDDVTLPRVAQVEVVPPTTEQVRTLLAAMPDKYRILGTLAAGAGLRQGEALGLTVDRVDFLRRQLKVDRQLVTPPKGDPRFAPPKTQASVRTVPLADSVVTALSEHVARFGTGPDGLLVVYEDGRGVRRNRFSAMWRQSVARAELEQAFRYHDLRHHFASVLIAGGCSVKVVQKALGHASANETLDTYSHLFPDGDDLTRQAVEAAFRPAEPVGQPLISTRA